MASLARPADPSTCAAGPASSSRRGPTGPAHAGPVGAPRLARLHARSGAAPLRREAAVGAVRCQAADGGAGAGAAAAGGAGGTALQSPPIVKSTGARGPSGALAPAVWELDFCSRPILDSRNKKVWELLICTPDRSFEYSEYFPNNMINSQELKRALERILARGDAPPPSKVRFFRAQMQTIIQRACAEAGLRCVPSRRCTTLMGWLEDRVETVYKTNPGYDPASPPLMPFEAGLPMDPPDALAGEQWAFVELPLSALAAEADAVARGVTFGETFSLEAAGLKLPPDTLIPGVAVWSQRAAALAAWTAGYDLAGLQADMERATLVLDTGVSQRWRYARWTRSAEADGEATAWEAAKAKAGGLHFLAVQTDPEAEKCNGFWLLRDTPPPKF